MCQGLSESAKDLFGGGQSGELATHHLNAMNMLDATLPWNLSFSYGRDLQAVQLETWGRRAEYLAAAGAAFRGRAKANGAATLGAYA